MTKKAKSKKPSRRPPAAPAPGSPEAVAIRRGERIIKLRAYRDAAKARIAEATVKPRQTPATRPAQDQELELSDLGVQQEFQQGLQDDLAFDDGEPHAVTLGDKTLTRVRLTARGNRDTTKARIGGGDPEAGAVVARLQTSLSQPMTLGGPDTLDTLDQFAAALHAEAPHFRAATVKLHQRARAHIEAGKPWFQHPPVLLVGGPGAGKSHFARAAARLAQIPCRVIDAAAMTSPAPLIGVDGSWRSGRPSLLVLSLEQHQTPNLVVVLDEVDKMSGFGAPRTAPPDSVLLGLLEPGTARGFEDSFLRQAVNMSFINWILTANDLDGVSAPVRDRCLVVHIEPPSSADFEDLARRQIEERGLDPELIDLIMRGFRTGQIKSLRKLSKVLDAAEAALARPMLN